jgi:hypothetical protein
MVAMNFGFGYFVFCKGGIEIMTRNVCAKDKIVRYIIGAIFIVSGIFWTSWILLLLGIYPLITAILSFCPINKAVNYNSCKIKVRRMRSN